MSMWMIAADVSGIYLSHHQVRGAHWGIHRGPPYPLARNSNGSLNTKKQAERKRNSKQVYGQKKSERADGEQTGLFQKKTQKSSESKELKGLEALRENKEYANEIEKIEDITQDCYLLTSSGMEATKADQKRFQDAADLGLKALSDMGSLDMDDDDDIEDYRDWFLYEDQTIGCAMIADLVNQGYTAKDCRKLISAVSSGPDAYNKSLSKHASSAAFEVQAGDYNDSLGKFADACEKVKNSQSSSRSAAKQTGLFSQKTPEQKIERQDQKWIKRNSDKVYKAAYKKSRKEMDAYVKNELNRQIRMRNANGKISSTYLNAYNRKLSEIMNKNVGDVEAPSGRVVRFIPKRGDVGVHVALADPMQNLSSFNRGIYGDGRVAYRKNYVNQI